MVGILDVLEITLPVGLRVLRVQPRYSIGLWKIRSTKLHLRAEIILDIGGVHTEWGRKAGRGSRLPAASSKPKSAGWKDFVMPVRRRPFGLLAATDGHALQVPVGA